MIKSGDLHDEIDNIDKVSNEFKTAGKLYEATVLKAQTLQIKLLLNIRQNQTKIMDAQGVKLTAPKSRTVSEKA